MYDDDDQRDPLEQRQDDALLGQLEQARELGFLGPGDLLVHVRNARLFSRLLTEQLAPASGQSPSRSSDGSPVVVSGASLATGASMTGHVLDLGSGGGVPGLVVAMDLPWLHLTLFDSMEKRCRHLTAAVTALGLDDRVDVVCGRAEVAAHSPALRARYDAVLARSFGPPAVTAECAAGFLLEPGGLLYVSEPPVAVADRWPAEGLSTLGLELGARVVEGEARIQVLQRVAPLDDRFPRRDGIPNKRPLF